MRERRAAAPKALSAAARSAEAPPDDRAAAPKALSAAARRAEAPPDDRAVAPKALSAAARSAEAPDDRAAAPDALAPQRTARRDSGEPGGAAPPLAEVLLTAARVWSAFISGMSLERALERGVPSDAARLRAAVQDVAYNAVRRRALGEWLIAELAARPPAAPVAALLAVALPQLLGTRHAPHTVVDQAVAAARAQAATAGATGFVNALLRNVLRQRDALLARAQRADPVRYNAPAWWIAALRAAQPDHWQAVLQAAAEPPPLVLRVNTRRIAPDAMLDKLAAHDVPARRVGAQALMLERALPVVRIPGFAEGEVSVQDAGAQLAAPWLDASDGLRVLDACAAPGGKTAHIAELADVDLLALELESSRAARIGDNLRRIGRPDAARVQVADARDVKAWWDGRSFDRILLDAPCTASGIVRRHPDIPWLRRESDVAHLATVQSELLEALWPLLGVGGRLLYVVCSVFPAEGSEQVGRFAAQHSDAAARVLPAGAPVVQLLPTAGTGEPWDGGALPTLHDGFCYALFEKSE